MLQLGAGLPGAGGRGTAAAKGNPVSRDGALVDLPPGVERFPLLFTVTAQNGAALRYVVELRRAPPDRNADLGSLTASAGVLTPPFSPRVSSYSIALPPNVDTVKLGAAAAGPAATVAVAGQPGIVPSGSVAYSLSLAPGASAAVGLIVRAEDGSQRQYLVQVVRGLPPAPAQTAAQPAQQQPVQPAPPQAQKPPVALAPQKPGQPPAVATPAAPAPQPAVTAPAQAQPVTPPPVQPAQQPAATPPAAPQPQPPAAQPPAQAAQQQPAAPASAPPSATPPAATGTDHVVVSAKNLMVGNREAAALVAAKETIGPSAKVTVRVYRSSQVLSQDSLPVDVKQQGGNLAVSLQYQSVGVSLGRDRLVEVEVVIPTTAGHSLYYREAMPAADEVSMSVPFLLYTATVPIAWPAVGSPVQTAGYVSWVPAGKGRAERAEDREDFQKNGKGEYGISIEIADAKTGRSYGKDTVWRKPGLARGQALRFTAAIGVPEGAVVGYVLTAQARNGRTWSATGQAQVWTTMLRYEGGFEPVLLPVSDELAPAPSDKGEKGSGKEKKN